MFSAEEMIVIGFSKKQADKILKNEYFVIRWKNKNVQELEAKLNKIQRVYGVSRDKAVKAVFSHPRFVGYDHSRVLSDVIRAYLPDDYSKLSFGDKHKVVSDLRSKAVKAVFSSPQFAGCDHSRVLSDCVRISNKLGLSKKEVLDIIFKVPQIVGYSSVRLFAMFDAVKRRNGFKLVKKGKLLRQDLINFFKSYHAHSPYVKPETEAEKARLAGLQEKIATSEKQAGLGLVHVNVNRLRESLAEKHGVFKPSKFGKSFEGFLRKRRIRV